MKVAYCAKCSAAIVERWFGLGLINGCSEQPGVGEGFMSTCPLIKDENSDVCYVTTA
jgi:hypothetical protein